MTIFETIRDEFRDQLRSATDGKKTSLPFLKIPLPPERQALEQPYQVMTIGGTNFFSAKVRKVHGEVAIIGEVVKKPFSAFSSGEDVMKLVADNLADDVVYLSLNFAYPMEPVMREGFLDGMPTSGTKGHEFSDLIGKPLGRSIEEYVQKTQQRKIHVAVANDTACLVLAGVGLAPLERIVGVIVGTGYNMGFFLDDHTVVNVEASCLSPIPQTVSGRAIHTNTGREFESEVSGGILYLHFNYYVDQGEVSHKKLVSTAELFSLAFGEKDEVQRLALEIVQTSARYVAAQISGMAEFKNSDIDVVMEGGLCTDKYLEIVQSEIVQLTSFTVNLQRVENSSLVGGAHLI